MNKLDDHDITATLGRIAAYAATPDDAPQQVARRLRDRRRRRRAVSGLAGVVAMGGLAAGAATFTLPADEQQVTVAVGGTPSGSVSGSVTEPTEMAATGQVPRLSVDLPGLDVVSAAVGTTRFTDEQLQKPLGLRWFQSFRPANDDWSGPGVYVHTGSADSFGFGEDAPGVTTVDINGQTGYLHSLTGAAKLGWRLPDGTTVWITSHGVSPDDLVSMARSMQLRPDASGWDIDQLPASLVPVLDEAGSHRPIANTHSLTFAGEAGRVGLNSSTDTAVAVEVRTAGLLTDGGADATNTTVRGLPAVVVRTSDDSRVVWYDRERGIVHYLVITGALVDQVDEVVASLVELDEGTWNALLDRADTTFWDGDTPSTTKPTAEPREG